MDASANTASSSVMYLAACSISDKLGSRLPLWTAGRDKQRMVYTHDLEAE